LSDTPDLGPVPQRITVDPGLVRRLVEEQFPQWADLPVQPVASGGWDNWTFLLGAGMLVRLPSAAEYALAVDKEHHEAGQEAASAQRVLAEILAEYSGGGRLTAHGPGSKSG
jgi:aminoglycoside phosphotransferase (APT) family kinase protein